MHVSCSSHEGQYLCNIANVVFHCVLLHQIESESNDSCIRKTVFIASRNNSLKFISSVFFWIYHYHACSVITTAILAPFYIPYLPSSIFTEIVEQKLVSLEDNKCFADRFAFLYLKSIIFNLFRIMCNWLRIHIIVIFLFSSCCLCLKCLFLLFNLLSFFLICCCFYLLFSEGHSDHHAVWAFDLLRFHF